MQTTHDCLQVVLKEPYNSITDGSAFQFKQLVLVMKDGNEDVVVVDLDHGLLDVGDLIDDLFIGNTTVQRVAEGPLVGLDTVDTIVVVFVHGDDGLVIDVLLSISDSHQQSELHTFLVTLGQKQPVRDACGALEPLKILTVFGHFNESLVGRNVRYSDGSL